MIKSSSCFFPLCFSSGDLLLLPSFCFVFHAESFFCREKNRIRKIKRKKNTFCWRKCSESWIISVSSPCGRSRRGLSGLSALHLLMGFCSCCSFFLLFLQLGFFCVRNCRSTPFPRGRALSADRSSSQTSSCFLFWLFRSPGACSGWLTVRVRRTGWRQIISRPASSSQRPIETLVWTDRSCCGPPPSLRHSSTWLGRLNTVKGAGRHFYNKSSHLPWEPQSDERDRLE